MADDLKFDIGLYNISCSNYEVRLKPNLNIDSYITNIQFTIKWPENSVEFENMSSDFDLELQGSIMQSNGFNYATFVSVPTTNNQINWEAGREYAVLGFSQKQQETGTIDVILASDLWANLHNGQTYIELKGIDYTGIIYHNALNVSLGICKTFDIGLFNPSCSNFEVRLKPNQKVKSNITNIQFTLKWPENTFNLTNLNSDYGLEMQGPIKNNAGFNYAVFVTASTTGIPIDWNMETEHTILTFKNNNQSSVNVDVVLASDAWISQQNGLPYVELMGLDNTGIVYNNALNANVGCPIHVYFNAFLQGAYVESNNEMRTSLNQAGLIPQKQPYTTIPWLYTGVENVSSFNSNIVDWILVELRDKTDPEIVVKQRACLLSKNGESLDVNQISGVSFDAAEGDYYLVVKQRNHLPVMSAVPISFPNELNIYDFTSISTLQQLELNPLGSGKYGLIAGNVNGDNYLRYNNQNNDRAPIVSIINSVVNTTNLNAKITGYYREDTSLDTHVIYNNINNDRSIIIQNLIKLTGSTNLNSVYNSKVP